MIIFSRINDKDQFVVEFETNRYYTTIATMVMKSPYMEEVVFLVAAASSLQFPSFHEFLIRTIYNLRRY